MNNQNAQFVLTILSIAGFIISFIFGVIKHKKLSVQIASGFLILTGTIVIVGYAFNVPIIYTFPINKIGMALPTGFCFMITGICLYILCGEVEFKNKGEKGY